MEAGTTHSDYRKFDDMLRMILDCTDKQVVAIRELCEEYSQEGKIHFGLHCSAQALMTCLVNGLADGEHIHFIDGGDGGYAIAAAELKRQRASEIPS